MKMTVISIVIGVLGTILKRLIKKSWKSEDERRPSKLEHCWDRLEYWAESCKLEETCCLSDSSGKPFANAGVKNPQLNNDNDFFARSCMVSSIPIKYW